ncbi:transglutaminase domain-containing protein [Haloimpatiens massiliensis]|uniref:transglutaminase domain-containing protein n=1 Tax=Haloimpatiens massiliensis TaxID=1658110 RepID=UPI000C830CFA|nr:transglutaminase domain-containing protein [Haloimpatiens massiliensis]
MIEDILEHYRQVGTYSYAGPYKEYYQGLPDNVPELGKLVCSQVIHRVTLKQGNTGANEKLIYGDMTKYPWYRLRCEDDILLTAVAMTAELFRLDDRGFILQRAIENKLVVTCRYVSVLMSAILKAKGIPCRSRAGFAPYFHENESVDHWINQYWNERENRWITFDADGFFNDEELGFNQFDIPNNQFDWAADTWLNIRNGKVDGKHFVYADALGTNSLKAVIRAIFYDFHALMNDEISYKFQPCYIDDKFDILTENDLIEIDDLAKLMLKPDKNFNKLISIWNSNRKYRILNSPLVGDWDNENN